MSDDKDTEGKANEEQVKQMLRLYQNIMDVINSESGKGNDPTMDALLSVLININAHVFSSMTPQLGDEQIFRKLDQFNLNVRRALAISFVSLVSNQNNKEKKDDE
jgi:hypothetical protein